MSARLRLLSSDRCLRQSVPCLDGTPQHNAPNIGDTDLRKENPTKWGVRRAVLQGAEHILRLGYAKPTAICSCFVAGTVQSQPAISEQADKHKKTALIGNSATHESRHKLCKAVNILCPL